MLGVRFSIKPHSIHKS